MTVQKFPRNAPVAITLALAFFSSGAFYLLSAQEPAAQDLAAPLATGLAGIADATPNDERTQTMLAERIAVEFLDAPLADVLEYLSDATKVQFYANWKKIEAAGLARDVPVTLQLTKVRASMALELALEQAGDGQLTYVVRDGVAIVSTAEDSDGAAILRVYNCRDLLVNSNSASEGGFGGASGGMPGVSGNSGYSAGGGSMMSPGGMGSGMMPSMGAGMGGASMGPPGGGGEPPVTSSAARRLVGIFTTSVAPSSWEAAGGMGTIAEYDGLIVVNHNPRIHAQVEQILKMLRQAAATGDRPAVIGQQR